VPPNGVAPLRSQSVCAGLTKQTGKKGKPSKSPAERDGFDGCAREVPSRDGSLLSRGVTDILPHARRSYIPTRARALQWPLLAGARAVARKLYPLVLWPVCACLAAVRPARLLTLTVCVSMPRSVWRHGDPVILPLRDRGRGITTRAQKTSTRSVHCLTRTVGIMGPDRPCSQ
jgi:hypothetical protein